MSLGVELIPGIVAVTAFTAALTAYFHDKRRIKNTCRETFFLSDNRTPSFYDHIEASEINSGVRELIKYCLFNNPDFIVGLNRGGVMMGAYISLSIGLPSKNFKRCCVTSSKENVYVECEFTELYGNVIVIDSITRTGKTMESAMFNLTKNYPNVKSISSATVVASTNDRGETICKALDYYVLGSKNINISLPWAFPYKPSENESRAKHIKDDYLKVNNKKVGELAVELYDDFENINLTNSSRGTFRRFTVFAKKRKNRAPSESP